MTAGPTIKIVLHPAAGCLHCRLMAAISEHFDHRAFDVNDVVPSIVAVIAELASVACPDPDNLEHFCLSLGPLVARKVLDLRAARAEAERGGRMLS